MSYNSAAGLGGMLKDGHKHWDDAVVRNIEAAVELASVVHTSMGPFGRHKLLVNHLEKMSVTSDCAFILGELEVEHPAAKLLELAAKRQDKECGDGTNLVVTLAGELLRQSLALMTMGLHTSEVIVGYQAAYEYLREHLEGLVCATVTRDDLVRVVEPVLAAKHYGSHLDLAPLVVQAGLAVMDNQGHVAPEAVRTVKLLGGAVSTSTMIPGYVATRGLESLLTEATNAKVVVFSCGIEASSTEAKGTVLMKNAKDLLSYNKSEETKMEEIIQGIAESGVKLLVTGGTVSEMALHFIDRYELLCLKLGSKWELRRLCQATGATALVRLGAPTPDEMGECHTIQQTTMGGRVLTVLTNPSNTKLATIVLKASTTSMLQDLERAVDDGVHALQVACRDGRCVYGAGATEFTLAQAISSHADLSPGLDQYAIRAFGTALKIVPRMLADTAGLDANAILAELAKANDRQSGVDLEGEGVHTTQVLDLYQTKLSAIQLAVDAALTVLRVDQIIMSKRSGGPKQ
jgi:T-complex protein 1 subunit theta